MINLWKSKKSPAFTLIEIITVVIIVGVITSLAIVSYKKIMERQYCNNAQRNLIRIDAAAQVYKIKNGNYGPAMLTTNAINTGLNIQISDTKFDYAYSGGAIDYTSFVQRVNGPAAYFCTFDSTLPISSTNPSSDPTYCTPIIAP